ncbi:hypothetical protein NYZ99_07400 [Maribacter litopenaei]|uniref:protein-tyrosine-phosphatase n=1 Tax=Maribacter litopenaei TaxID=2976127 RepID=A0ABY5YCF6_9FLAO|nr:CpsB/CapC family capsule biosynthesis tyrosine phosphatase [Maribacter litopenaei]UWX56115.1 hypothetical protein NYZ99_07400 [Maribacter litopenaei]
MKTEIMRLANNYILIEMSYLQPSLNLFEMVERISEKNLYPILAHPERYNFLHGKMKSFENYKKKGMLLQLNILSISRILWKRGSEDHLILIRQQSTGFYCDRYP